MLPFWFILATNLYRQSYIVLKKVFSSCSALTFGEWLFFMLSIVVCTIILMGNLIAMVKTRISLPLFHIWTIYLVRFDLCSTILLGLLLALQACLTVQKSYYLAVQHWAVIRVKQSWQRSFQSSHECQLSRHTLHGDRVQRRRQQDRRLTTFPHPASTIAAEGYSLCSFVISVWPPYWSGR